MMGDMSYSLVMLNSRNSTGTRKYTYIDIVMANFIKFEELVRYWL